MSINNELAIIDKQSLYSEVANLIDQSRRKMYSQANANTVQLFWEIGKRINDEILKNSRAEYGKQVIVKLSEQLVDKYGRSFAVRNLRRMMQFAEQFLDFEIVSALPTQLSWSHITEILPLKSREEQLFYLSEASNGLITQKELRNLITRKAFERKEIANNQISASALVPLDSFKDPYLFDVLGLKDEYLESDLEEAILRELEKFILEFGKGFAFVERQKRMIIDGHDHHLDLLFYNRQLNRLVAIELKMGKFEAAYSGQMKLYLNWLNRYEKQKNEQTPIGLILCSEGGREEIELLEMDRDGILVAEYWTKLPPKAEFEQKIQQILSVTKEQLKQRKLLGAEDYE